MNAKRYQHCTAEAKAKRAVAAASVAKSLLGKLKATQGQNAMSEELQVSVGVDRQQLADFLSVDRSAMSGELSRMQKEGIISYKKNQFTLCASYDERDQFLCFFLLTISSLLCRRIQCTIKMEISIKRCAIRILTMTPFDFRRNFVVKPTQHIRPE